ncbi:hypothetical protein V6N12_013996 [Hibiscus sabdariffa]|uniref:Uncharacterized protein n=1 Tax=Hibiscus sabdariffa TaxID=183260 RepID=A0ABR2BF68_9ROSI
MATGSSSSVEGMPLLFSSATIQERYDKVVAAKNIWEEQGANLNGVMEFYANNADGNDTVTVRGRGVPAKSATINNILDLPNDSPSIYALIDILEDEDLDTIKDQLCEQGTEWNVKGKNPKTINRPHHYPKVGEVIAKELSAACQNDKDATPTQMVMPTPPTSEQTEPSAPVGAQPSTAATLEATPLTSPAPTPAATPATLDSRQSTPDSPLGSTPTPPSSPPPARSEEAVPFHILQLRSQLQRIEARQLQFMEETKSTPKQSEGVGNTEKVNLSSSDENDIFDWHTRMEHHGPICPTTRRADIPGSSSAQKRKEPTHADGEVALLPTATNIDTARRRGKTPAGRIMISDRSYSPEVVEQPLAKRMQRCSTWIASYGEEEITLRRMHDPRIS